MSENTSVLNQHSYAYKLRTSRIGLWLFILSDAFMFSGPVMVSPPLLTFSSSASCLASASELMYPRSDVVDAATAIPSED